MSGTPHLEAPTTPVWPMYRTLVSVGLACGLLIVSAYELTRPIIQRNKIAARQAAVLQVLPGAHASRTFRVDEAGAVTPVPPESEGEGLVFAGFDAQRRLVGLAIEAQGMGYQDVVRVLYGYSFEQQAVIGFRVLESRDTPGLGDRVETDPAFLRNFEHLDVSLGADGKALAHPVEFVKQGLKVSPWQVDGITGATITSRAVALMIARSAATWIPRVAARRAEFRPEE